MPADQIRVVPAARPRGIIAACALFGAAHAAVLILFRYLLGQLLTGGLSAGVGMLLTVPLLLILLVFIPAFALARVLARVTQTLWVFGLAGLSYGVGFTAALGGYSVAAMGYSNLVGFALIGMLGGILVYGGVLSLVLVLVFLAARWVTSAFQFRLAPQNGRLCWQCAYELGGPQITICPECGTPADFNRFKSAWLVSTIMPRLWLARPLVAALAVAGLILTAVPIWREYQANALARAITNRHDGKSGFAFIPYFQGQTTWYAARDGSPRSIAVITSEGSGTVSHRLQVMGAPSMPGGPGYFFLEFGSFEVYAHLTPAQSLWIIDHGVPVELENALLAAADANGWVPPKPNPTGAATYTSSNSQPAVTVDPAPFIP